MASQYENALAISGHLGGKTTCHFGFFCKAKQAVEHTTEFPVIWDSIKAPLIPIYCLTVDYREGISPSYPIVFGLAQSIGGTSQQRNRELYK